MDRGGVGVIVSKRLYVSKSYSTDSERMCDYESMCKRQRHVPQPLGALAAREAPDPRPPQFHVAPRDVVLKTRVSIESPVLVTVDAGLFMTSNVPPAKRRHCIVFALDNSNAMSDVWVCEDQTSNIEAVNTLMKAVLAGGLSHISLDNTHIGIVVYGSEADVMLNLTPLKEVSSAVYSPLRGNGGAGNMLAALDLATKQLRERAPVDSIQSVVILTASQPSSGILDGRVLRKHLTSDMNTPSAGQVFFHVIGIGNCINAAFFKTFCDEGRGALFAFAEEAGQLPVALGEITSSIAQIEGAIVIEIADGLASSRCLRLGVKFANQAFCKEIYVTPHEMKAAAAQGPRIKIRLLGFEGDPEGAFTYKYCTNPVAGWQSKEAFADRDKFYNSYLLARREVETFRTTVAKADSWIKKAAVAQICVERARLIDGIKDSPLFLRLLAENRSYQIYKNCTAGLTDRVALLHATRTAPMFAQL